MLLSLYKIGANLKLIASDPLWNSEFPNNSFRLSNPSIGQIYKISWSKFQISWLIQQIKEWIALLTDLDSIANLGFSKESL